MIQKVLKVEDLIVITIPKEFLKALDLEVGDKVDLKVDKEKREIVITPAVEKRINQTN